MTRPGGRVGTFLRRCRGALGISVTWGGVWAAVFAALGLTVGILSPESIDPGEGPLRISLIGAFYGFVSGAVFGGLLSLAEGGKRLLDLSLRRVALCGAVATAVWPLLTPVANSISSCARSAPPSPPARSRWRRKPNCARPPSHRSCRADLRSGTGSAVPPPAVPAVCLPPFVSRPSSPAPRLPPSRLPPFEPARPPASTG